VTARTLIIAVQMCSFLALAGLLACRGEWRLAGAQALIGGATWLVYA